MDPAAAQAGLLAESQPSTEQGEDVIPPEQGDATEHGELQDAMQDGTACQQRLAADLAGPCRLSEPFIQPMPVPFARCLGAVDRMESKPVQRWGIADVLQARCYQYVTAR